MGDFSAGFTGEGVAGDAEAGTLSGEAATVRVGDETEAESGEGAGDGLSGLLTGGDTLVFPGVASSGRNGSVKKRKPGDFTGVT